MTNTKMNTKSRQPLSFGLTLNRLSAGKRLHDFKLRGSAIAALSEMSGSALPGTVLSIIARNQGKVYNYF